MPHIVKPEALYGIGSYAGLHLLGKWGFNDRAADVDFNRSCAEQASAMPRAKECDHRPRDLTDLSRSGACCRLRFGGSARGSLPRPLTTGGISASWLVIHALRMRYCWELNASRLELAFSFQMCAECGPLRIYD